MTSLTEFLSAHGTANAAAALPARIVAKVEVDDSSCWLWTASLNRNGYGLTGYTASDGTRRSIVAHRFVYQTLVGPIPEGLQLDHLCRVRCCVNPDHLEPVTQRENLLRGETIVAAEAAKTHCPQGHPYSGANLYVSPKGDRICRTCTREKAAARLAKRMAENPEKELADHRARDAAYRARKRAQKAVDHPDFDPSWLT